MEKNHHLDPFVNKNTPLGGGGFNMFFSPSYLDPQDHVFVE